MDMNLLAASVLITLGAAIMLINIISYRHTMQAASKRIDVKRRQTRVLVRVHHVLMIFFFVSYLGILYLFVNNVSISSSLFVAVVFFFGAIFVYMSILIQKRMFTILQTKNEHLENEKLRLIHLNDQLKNEMEGRIRAETSDQKKSDFLSLVSHELRTPLTSIYGFTKLINKGINNLEHNESAASFDKKKKRVGDNLEIISKECTRLTRLINNVLDLAKIEAGQMDWEDREVSIHDITDGALNALEGVLAVNKDVSVRVMLQRDLPNVIIDPDLFTQVIINIVNNAIKFTESGEVRLEGWLREDGIRLSIHDQGRGIPHDNLELIFDKFHVVRTGDTLGEKRQGTGLGLPICKQIVSHYAGRIWAESIIGKGSTFHVLLPKSLYAED